MQKAIGIVGGMGPYAGLDLLQKVYDSVDVRSDQDYPDVFLISASRLIPDRSMYIRHPETENPSVGISYCVKKLASMGATHIGISCNTAHAPIILKQVEASVELEGLPIKLLNIVEETCKYVSATMSSGRIALFATEGTYLSKTYQHIFEKDDRFSIFEPDDADKKKIWAAIYDRDFGIKAHSNPIHPQAVENFRAVTEKMIEENGIDSVIMGCTEIPLGMGRLQIPVNLIDPAKILARALVEAVAPDKLKRQVNPQS